jgi:hypothetical protein
MLFFVLHNESSQTVLAPFNEKDAENMEKKMCLYRPDVKRIWRQEGKYPMLEGLKKDQNGAG